ncbi:class II aldolase/adducin family protein [Fluviispira sanaruensis]|uniref:Methylthioribulose 1-phosphate dehydratase n=1 Tax=Fluviispira sanaruensis TaxID=2493639 RepID=A0A4P2VTP5_FLUSA|nr:class II aldolase/adducin family protein [Fluviispira sanaruensis]BBH52252.1 methylthioribulose 1-phosphate dehydratase [Fluviispira sanaruensis]
MKTLQKYIKDASFFPLSLMEIYELNSLCKVVTRLDARKAIPATSSNFSLRTKPDEFLITKSGLHKRNLNPTHFIRTDLSGNPLHSLSPKPSDETLLHALIYKNFISANAVLHCHAPELDVFNLESNEFTQFTKQKQYDLKFGFIKIKGHELLKALGFKSHTEDFFLPIIENHQDMSLLSNVIIENFIQNKIPSPLTAFVLERHGIYCFGNSISQAEMRLEAILHFAKNLKK